MAISNDEILNVSLSLFSQNGYDGQIKADNSSLLAFDYTAPITMLIHLCDREPKKEKEIMVKIKEHIEHFISVYGNNNPTDDNTAQTVSGMTLLGLL